MLKVGIIGFGFIGKVHAYAYSVLPFYYDPTPVLAKVTHVVTSRPETAERARRLLGAEVASTDFRSVTEDPSVDIVHICTPNHLHRDALLSAMAHGKHIYCDKPLTATVEEAEEVRRTLSSYTGTAQMTFHNRFFPATLLAKRLIEEGRLGRILQFRAAYLHAGSADPQAPLKWKLTKAAGGGVIADLCSHVLDLLDHLVGPFDSFTAWTLRPYAERPLPDDPTRSAPTDAEDGVVALAKLENGAVGVIEASKLATGTEDELRLEIHGQRGALRFNLMKPHWLEFYDATESGAAGEGLRGWKRFDTGQRYDPPATNFPSPKASIGWLRAHVACLANFLYAVAEGKPAQPDLEQGVRVQYLMDCLSRSAASQTVVSVPRLS